MKSVTVFSGVPIILALTLTAATASNSPHLFVVKNPTVQNGAVGKPRFLIAQQSRTRRIQFPRGAVGTVVENSVVRGDRDIYLLRAQRRQTMTLKITSLEQNAVFDIKAPNGEYLKQGVTSWNGVLPRTGDYSIIVGGTRGNATYALDVTIR